MGSSYREQPPPAALDPLVASVWERISDGERAHRIVPDGCVDLIWLGEAGLVFAGADTGPRVARSSDGMRAGVRLRPGAAGAVLGLPACEVRDRVVVAQQLWGDRASRLSEALAVAPHARRLELLLAAVARRGAVPDALVTAAADRLAAPGERVATVAAAFGVSERTLHRRMVAAVGYGPKLLARVARLARLTAVADEPSLAARAYAAGYASQAHMSDEVRRLTGTTPVRFLKDTAPIGA